MSDEVVEESQVVKETKAFDKWFDNNLGPIMAKAKETGLDAKIKEIMRMSWRNCCEYKNKEIDDHLEYISFLKKDIDLKQQKYDELHLELQKVSNKLIQAEKNSKR
jgi:hypothetical protein